MGPPKAGLAWINATFGYGWTAADASPSGLLLGVARVTGHIEGANPDPWYLGPPSFGWTLDDVVALRRPVPFVPKFGLGLWPVPDATLALVRMRWRLALGLGVYPLRLGFTGTRAGLTDPQARTLAWLLTEALCGATTLELHHGDCQGADRWAACLFDLPGNRIVSHPCTLKAQRAFHVPTHAAHRTLDPLPPLERNAIIAASTDVLVACPKEADGVEELRSGTWATLRDARALERPVLIVRPSGVVEVERGAALGLPDPHLYCPANFTPRAATR